MPGLIEQFREAGSIEEAGALDIWLTVILSLNNEFETLRRHYDYRIKSNPLHAGTWSSRAAILSKLGEFDAAQETIERGRAMAGDHPWLHGDELFLAIARHDKATVLALLRRRADQKDRRSRRRPGDPWTNHRHYAKHAVFRPRRRAEFRRAA